MGVTYTGQFAEQTVVEADLAGELVVFPNDPAAAAEWLAEGFVTPMRIDEQTVLQSVRGEGPNLTHNYEVADEFAGVTDFGKANVTTQNCSTAPFTAYLRNGVVIEHIYKRADGTEMGSIVVTAADC
ncbi:MAG: hypothetical protein MK180_13280 [Rhodobacteraceae bacterium]|nr:hypothetical protein [Paracoccaceae bacterium]